MSVSRSRRILRIERQVGAAGLQHRQQPHHQFERTLGQHPDQHIGPDARGFADDAPGGWRGRRARRSSACGPRTSPPPHPACAQPARQTAQASVAGAARPQPAMPRADCATACAVSFQARRMVSRSARPGSSQAAQRARRDRPPPPPAAGSAAAQRHDAWLHRTGRLRIPARRRCRPAARRPRAARSARATGRTWRSPVATGCGCTASPGSSSRAARAAPASNASITWNSGCRDSERAGLSTSTSRSNGRSAWP